MQCLEVLWLGCRSMMGQAMQPMADGDINCGQSMQKRFLVGTGCRVVGFRWLPTMRFLRCCRMPKGGVEISPFWVPMRLWHFAASMGCFGSFGFACKSWCKLWPLWMQTAFRGMLACVFGHFC